MRSVDSVLSVCPNFLMSWLTYRLHFGRQVYNRNTKVKVDYQGHGIKVKVTDIRGWSVFYWEVILLCLNTTITRATVIIATTASLTTSSNHSHVHYDVTTCQHGQPISATVAATVDRSSLQRLCDKTVPAIVAATVAVTIALCIHVLRDSCYTAGVRNSCRAVARDVAQQYHQSYWYNIRHRIANWHFSLQNKSKLAFWKWLGSWKLILMRFSTKCLRRNAEETLFSRCLSFLCWRIRFLVVYKTVSDLLTIIF